MHLRGLCAREPGYFLFQRGNEDGEVFVHYHVVKKVLALTEECEVLLRILEPVADMRFCLAAACAEAVQELAQHRTLALAGRKEPQGKDRATAVVTSESLE